MSVRDFFSKDASFKLKAEELIKTNDVKLLQLLIGAKNPTAFLQYNASFYLSKLNIRQAEYHAKVLAPMEVKKHICEKIKNNESISVITNAEIENVMFKTKQNLKNRELLIPKSNSEKKFLLDSKSTDIKNYVEETNIGNLCAITESLAVNVYDNLVKQNELDKTIKHISNRTPSEIIHQFENDIEILNTKKETFLEEFRGYNNYIQKIKDGSFLSEWYDELVRNVIEEAFQNKYHLLYQFVDCHKVDEDVHSAGIHIAPSLKKNIRRFWNKELLTRVSEKINVSINERDEKKLLEYIDLTAHDFANHLSEKFDEMKSEVLGNNVRKLVDNFAPFLVIEEEQKVLDYLLQTAARYKKKDMVLLLIFNGASYKTIENINDFIDEETTAFSEVKRLYKDMPSINLPKFTSAQIIDIFPIEEIVKTANLIIQQEETLHNKKEKLEEILEKYPWYFLWTTIPAAINMSRVNTAEPVIEKVREAFEDSIPSKSLKPLKEELKDIRAEEGWFSLNTEILKEIEKLAASTANTNKSVSVKELIQDIAVCKSVYMKDKLREEMVLKNPNTKSYAEKLKRETEGNRKEKQNLTKLKGSLKDEEKKIEDEKSAIQEEIHKAKIRKEKAKREKGEAELKLRMADARVIAIFFLHEEAENYNIDIESVKHDVQNFLLEAFTFKVLNDTVASEFIDLLQKFRNIENCASSEYYLLSEIDELQTEFNELCTIFTKLADEEGNLITKIPLCDNPKHFEFMSTAVLKMREAKKAAQKAKGKVEAETNDVIT